MRKIYNGLLSLAALFLSLNGVAQTSTIYLTTSGGSFSSEKWVSITDGPNGTGTVIWDQDAGQGGGGTYGNGSGLLTDEPIVINDGQVYYINTYDAYADGWDGTTYELRNAMSGGGILIANNGGSSPDDGTNSDATGSFEPGNELAELESSEMFSYSPPACPTPSMLTASNITATSADLGWTVGGSETVWNVEWGAAGFTPATGAEDGSAYYTTSNLVNATGLSGATNYEFYVQAVCGSPSPLIISAVFDGPLTGGTPKGVELYVMDDIADLSQFGISSANNGGGPTGTPEFTFPAVSATAGSYIYIASEATEFTNYFGFAPDYTDAAVNINGDDAIELFYNGNVVDVFGDVNVVGTGQPWEYLDGWAYRVSSTGADGATFDIANWTFSGINALDGETDNGTAATPVPVGTFTNMNDFSPWVGPFAFSTPCSVYTPTYLEDFTSFVPTCWEEADAGDPTTGPSSFGSGSWSADGFANVGSSGATKINLYSTGKSDWLLSPEFDLSSGGPWQLEFDLGIYNWGTGTPGQMGSDDEVQLLYTDDGGATWNNLDTYDATTTTSAAGDHFVYNIASLMGTSVQFAFWASEGTVNDPEDIDFMVDNFEIAAGPSCPDPSNLTVTYVGVDTVIFDWAPGFMETEWIVEWGPDGFTPGTGNVFATTENPDTLTGLSAVTDYDIYVRAFCAVGDTSGYVGPLDVLTQSPCPSPSNLTLVGQNVDSVFFSFTNNSTATDFNIQYGPTGFSIGAGMQFTTQTTTDTITGLLPGADYDIFVQADCGADTSLWIGPLTITTPVYNDNSCDAIDIPVDGNTYSFSNVGATSQAGEPTNVSPTSTVWFKFAVPAGASGINVSLCNGSAFDTQLAAYTVTDCGNYSTYSFLGYNDDFCGLQSELEFCPSTPGDSVYIVVDGFGTSQGTFGLTVTPLTLEAGMDNSMMLCVSEDSLDLNTVVMPVTEGGTWEFPTNPAAIYDDSLFNAQNVPSGMHDAWYIVSNTCGADTAIATLDIAGIPNAGTAVSPFEVCNVGGTSLYGGLTGTVDVGGTWNDDSGTGLLVNGDTFWANGVPTGTYDFTYTASNGVCPDESTTVTVTVQNCVGIDENDSFTFSVYPNPSNGTFMITTDKDADLNLQVQDLQGKVVYESNRMFTSGQPQEMTLSNVETGIYFVRLFGDEYNVMQRIIIE